jgi:hypothetical protein
MKVVDPATLELFTDDHPTGALAQRYLLLGEDGTRENFMLSIAETVKRFTMARHRHNFDQFRFALAGDMSMGPDRALREGHLGYFPEGTSYGPQDDGAGPKALVLQFGGASGYGYMSPGQYRAGRAALRQVGRFEGPVFISEGADGVVKRTFSINAIWEEALGAKLLIPAPRYDKPIFINPDAFRFVPVEGAHGAFRKALGAFSEREVAAEMWLLRAGARLDLAGTAAIRLLFVLCGSGSAGGGALGRHFAVRSDPGETLSLAADSELKLLSFVLPPVSAEWEEPGLPSFEPVPNEAVPESV